MHDGKSCDVGQISLSSPQIKGTYAAISVTEDTGQNSQLYNSTMSPRCNYEGILIGCMVWQPCWKNGKTLDLCISETAPRKKRKLGTYKVLLMGN